MLSNARFALLSLALLSGGALRAETIFQCRIGARQATVTLENDRLTYSYGRPGRPEISIAGGPTSGNVSYHRTLFGRGEHQILRFRRDGHSYLVSAIWAAPSPGGSEYVEGRVVVMRGEAILRELRCRRGEGDMREYPVFTRLPQEPANPLPEP